MKMSSESILVTEEGVIVAGRGGDVCRFVETEEEVEVESREVGSPMLGIDLMNLLGVVPDPNFMFEESSEEDEPLDMLNGD